MALRCITREAEAAAYVAGSGLQQAVARRLAVLWRRSPGRPVPAGPLLDLGGGSGTLALALQHQGCRPLTVVDCSEPLLRRADGLDVCRWNLEWGLPPLGTAPALLASSFALHWLPQPAATLGQWCRALRPQGQLLLAVPTAGSFSHWKQASRCAGLPWTGVDLPRSSALQQVLERQLTLRYSRCLSFNQHWSSPLGFFRHLKRLGLAATAAAPLGAGALRRIDRCWPRQADGTVTVDWEVLTVLAEKT